MVKNTRAFSMVELLIVLGITTFVISAIFGLLRNAQSSFYNTDASIQLRDSLRNIAERISLELRQTGTQGGVEQFSILSGTGVNSSDIIRFSMPIVCSSTASFLDASGNPSYWGAPLTWGCDSYTCMDANNDCAVLEYKYVQYALNTSGQIERTVLNSAITTVSGSTSVLGNNITNFQITHQAGSKFIYITITGQITSATGKVIGLTYSTTILINNSGG